MQPVVRTTSGAVEGRRAGDTSAFLGVPFAAPPFGPRRFGVPEPVQPWDGVRRATSFGPTPCQKVPYEEFGIPEPIIAGEDVLNLNVFTPEPGGAGLPVLVWIHGGGFVGGCSASPWYDGSRFARDGVVVVSVNYRLGIEGFLPLEGAPGNRGVLDWVAALEWVRDNIAGFGGDPARVTVAGQSAGATAVATLLAVPRAEGLFHRGICMSGIADAAADLAMASARAALVAEHLDVAPTREAFSRFSVLDLVEAGEEVAPTSGYELATLIDYFAGGESGVLRPLVDDELIPVRPLDAVRAGAGRDVALLVGTTTEEANLMARMVGPELDDEAVSEAIVTLGLPREHHDAYRAHVGTMAPVERLGRAITDCAFRLPMARLIDAHVGAGGATHGYEFRWRSPSLDGLVGAAHVLDVPFAFDVLDAPGVDVYAGADPPQALADDVHRAFVDFIVDGDPGWAPCTDGRRRRMAFADPSLVVADPVAVELELWDGHG